MLSRVIHFCRTVYSALALSFAFAFSKKVGSQKDEDVEMPSILILNDTDFAIAFRKDKIEGIIPTPKSDKQFDAEREEHMQHVENTIAYVMHALMREDWQDEFFDAVDEYLQNAPSESDLEALRRRSEFKLIINEDVEDLDQ